MIGLLIGEKHTYNDFGMRMLSFMVSPPEPVVVSTEIPGMDSVLDLSEAFGEVKYKKRSLTAEFNMEEQDTEVFQKRFSDLCNYMHGIKHSIQVDADHEFVYIGRITVSASMQGCYYKITIAADVEPYKVKKEKTVVTATVEDEKIVVCQNLRKSVVPTIITNSEFRLGFEGGSYAISAGESKIPNIVFKKGDNIIECSGTGNITFEYQEGGL